MQKYAFTGASPSAGCQLNSRLLDSLTNYISLSFGSTIVFAHKWQHMTSVTWSDVNKTNCTFTGYGSCFFSLPVPIASTVWPVLTWQLSNTQCSKQADRQLGYMQHQGMCPRGDKRHCLTPCHMAVLCGLCVHVSVHCHVWPKSQQNKQNYVSWEWGVLVDTEHVCKITHIDGGLPGTEWKIG